MPGLAVDSGAVSSGILCLEMQGLVSYWQDLTAQPTCWNAKGNRFREGVRVPTASKVPATESEIPALSNLISATHLLQSFFAASPETLPRPDAITPCRASGSRSTPTGFCSRPSTLAASRTRGPPVHDQEHHDRPGWRRADRGRDRRQSQGDQELLGHSSLAMMMCYAYVAPERLRTAVCRFTGLTSGERIHRNHRRSGASSAA